MIITGEFGEIEIIKSDKEPIDNLNYILYKLKNKEINIYIEKIPYIFNRFKLPTNSYLIKFSINKQIRFCFNTYKSNVEDSAYVYEPGKYSVNFYFKNNKFIMVKI